MVNISGIMVVVVVQGTLTRSFLFHVGIVPLSLGQIQSTVVLLTVSDKTAAKAVETKKRRQAKKSE